MITDSGYKWGCFDLVKPEPYRFMNEEQGGSVRAPRPKGAKHKPSQHLSDCDDYSDKIVKGHDYTRWTAPWQLQSSGCRWWFWDNPLIPQLTPHTDKSWTRLVQGGHFPFQSEDSLGDPTAALARFREITGEHLRDRIPVRAVRPGDSRTVLWAESSDNNHRHYLGLSTEELYKLIERECHRQGLKLERRPKLSRGQRDPIDPSPYRCVVVSHSAIETEVLCLGRPVVRIGQGTMGKLATTWREFTEGQLKSAREDQVLTRVEQLMACTAYKKDLFTGHWHDYHPRQDQGDTEWIKQFNG